MKVLLDTRVLLWWLGDSHRLGPRHRTVIGASETEPWVSSASVWEISIKSQKGLLSIDGDLVEAIRQSQISVLPIDAEHAWMAGWLPNHHADPFDRMLVAQAILEGMAVATVDPAFSDYDVTTI